MSEGGVENSYHSVGVGPLIATSPHCTSNAKKRAEKLKNMRNGPEPKLQLSDWPMKDGSAVVFTPHLLACAVWQSIVEQQQLFVLLAEIYRCEHRHQLQDSSTLSFEWAV